MDSNKVGSQLVKSISFEVEAIPQDNSVEITAGKMTPLNVRVRVRKKEDGVVSRGTVTILRRGQAGNALETMRLASSEMTIMSFNMLMEADLEKQVIEKPKRNFFGICLGARGEKDNDKYLPSTTDDKDNKDSTSEPGIVKHRRRYLQGKLGAPAPYTHRKKDKFFGKCKPGGCLDPPFGEDKYSYQPQNITRIKALKAPVTTTLLDTREIETEKTSYETDHLKKKEDMLSAVKVTKKANNEDDSILNLYQGEKKHNLHNDDSDYIITYPPTLSSSGLLLGGEKNEKNVPLKTSGARQSRKSFNEFSSAYFSPSKTPRESKDLSGKAERPKNYSTKDINQSDKPESKSSRSASNTNLGLTNEGVVGLTTIGIAAAKSGKSKHGESEKKQQQANPLPNESNSFYLGHTESASFPVEIPEKDNVEFNKNKLAPYAYSHANSAEKCDEQSNAANNVENDRQAIGDKDFTRGQEAHNIGLVEEVSSASRVNQPVITLDMAEKSQEEIRNIKKRNLTKYNNDIPINSMLNVDDDFSEENKMIRTTSDRMDGSEPFDQHEGQQLTSQIKDKKRLRGRKKGMLESDKDEISINSSKSSHGGFKESEYFPWEGQQEDEYSSKLKANLKSYSDDKNDSEITGRNKAEEERKKEQVEKGGGLNDDEGQKEIDPQERSGNAREYSYMGDQRIKKYSTQLGEDEKLNTEAGRVGEIADDQEKVLPKAYEFSSIDGKREKEYNVSNLDDRQPFTHQEADQSFQDPQRMYIQKADTDQEYSRTLEQGRNEHYSRLGEDQTPYFQEGINQTTINSNENILPKDFAASEFYSKSGQRGLQEAMDQDITDHQGEIMERDGTQKEHSLHDQPERYSNGLKKDQKPYSQEITGQHGLKHGNLEGDIFLRSGKVTSDEEFQRYIKSPLQKECKELKQDEIYDLMQQDEYTPALDVTAKATDQTEDSIFLDLAFKTSIEENQTTIRTLDAAKQNDESNVFVVRSLTKFGKAIVVPISSQHVINLEIKPASHSPLDTKSRTPKSITKFDSAKSILKSSGSSLNEAHKALSIVYNKDLIPLQSIIKDLKDDINVLAAQQMMLRDRLTCRRIKPTIKKCGCGRHFYPKI